MDEQKYLSNFPFDAADFLKKLSKNNNRDWFNSHKEEYNEKLFFPAQEFVIEVGKRLHKISPNFNAIPKTDKSIFRLHRDVRFSKDKAPYKNNLGVLFWEGRKKKMECSGLYFHLEKNSFGVFTGMYVFSNDALKKYRDVISKEKKGAELQKILTKITKSGNYDIGGKHYKKVPRGFDNNYKHADLLLYNGVYAFMDKLKFDELKEKNAVEISIKVFKDLKPLHDWLINNL